jgi:hypothetical protein
MRHTAVIDERDARSPARLGVPGVTRDERDARWPARLGVRCPA